MVMSSTPPTPANWEMTPNDAKTVWMVIQCSLVDERRVMLQDVATVVIVRSRYDLDLPRVAVVTTRHRSVERLCRAAVEKHGRAVAQTPGSHRACRAQLAGRRIEHLARGENRRDARGHLGRQHVHGSLGESIHGRVAA